MIAMFKSVLAAISGARNIILAVLATAALTMPTSYCAGLKSANAQWKAKTALANAKAQELDAHGRDVAAAERVADALAVERNEEDLIDAISQVADDQPDRVRVALGCQRLRVIGVSEADIPAVCRP